ncbi:MAG TPA: hypothetical protein VGW38_07770, partial [Chloroflexota bacterium]|nr:hypothetical protein [Chloroflexota bacterium]
AFDKAVDCLVTLRQAICEGSIDASGPEVTAALAAYRQAWSRLHVARAMWLKCVKSTQAKAAPAAQDRSLSRLRFMRWLVQTGRLSEWPAP